MKLIVIRHGETDMNMEDRLQGSKDAGLPLNAVGRKEIAELRDTLRTTPDIIYASTLARTQETAHILNERFHLPIILSDKIIERDFGTLSGKKRSEIDPQIIRDDLEGTYDYHPYSGESVEDVTKRIHEFISILQSRNEKIIMIVTHRGIIRILYDLYPNSTSGESIVPGSKHIFDIP